MDRTREHDPDHCLIGRSIAVLPKSASYDSCLDGYCHSPIADVREREAFHLQPGEVQLFRDIIMNHYRVHGRQFPWRETSDPYRILLSELMLQQTQATRVLPKYQEFIERWPDFTVLDQARFSEVLGAWKGLGYNRRAAALKQIARKAAAEYGGTLPDDFDRLRSFPMIGPATAAAVTTFAFGRPSLYLETNTRRVLIHFFFPDAERVADRELYPLLDIVQLREDPKTWYYALMDYGVLLKNLIVNPNRRSAGYARQSPFKDSNRMIRGQILTVILERGSAGPDELFRALPFDEERIAHCLEALLTEGLLALHHDSAAEPFPRYLVNSV